MSYVPIPYTYMYILIPQVLCKCQCQCQWYHVIDPTCVEYSYSTAYSNMWTYFDFYLRTYISLRHTTCMYSIPRATCIIHTASPSRRPIRVWDGAEGWVRRRRVARQFWFWGFCGWMVLWSFCLFELKGDCIWLMGMGNWRWRAERSLEFGSGLGILSSGVGEWVWCLIGIGHGFDAWEALVQVAEYTLDQLRL
jgi:hypothetical protein